MSDSAYLHSSGEGAMAAILHQEAMPAARGDAAPPRYSLMAAAGPSSRAAALEVSDLAQAMADIEHASSTLRRAAPGLETWSSSVADRPTLPPPQSVWVVIGVVWTSTIVVVGAAVLMFASLLG
jgi:hypothetical protein